MIFIEVNSWCRLVPAAAIYCRLVPGSTPSQIGGLLDSWIVEEQLGEGDEII